MILIDTMKASSCIAVKTKKNVLSFYSPKSCFRIKISYLETNLMYWWTFVNYSLLLHVPKIHLTPLTSSLISLCSKRYRDRSDSSTLFNLSSTPSSAALTKGTSTHSSGLSPDESLVGLRPPVYWQKKNNGGFQLVDLIIKELKNHMTC